MKINNQDEQLVGERDLEDWLKMRNWSARR